MPMNMPVVGLNRSRTRSSSGFTGVAGMGRFCTGTGGSPQPEARTYAEPRDCNDELNGELDGRSGPASAPRGRRRLGRLAPPLPPRATGGGPGRRRGQGRLSRHPLHQDDRQGLRPRPGHPDGRPDHARGCGHPGQGPGAVLEGDAAGSRRPVLPAGRGRVRLPRHGADGPRDARCVRRAHRLGGHRVPLRARGDGHQARRHPGRRRGGRPRDRHGDRPRRVPRRPLPRGLRGDRRRPRRLRRRPPEGDLRDRRAADLRQRPPGVLAGDDGRRALHQDLHRQDPAGRDAAGDAGDARGRPRLPRVDRHRWSA